MQPVQPTVLAGRSAPIAIHVLWSQRQHVLCFSLTSAAGTPSGGRQCRTIIPSMGTSFPWGSCSKFFRRSAEFNAIIHYTSKNLPPRDPVQPAELSNSTALPCWGFFTQITNIFSSILFKESFINS